MEDSAILIVGSKGQVGRALSAKFPGAKKVGHEELDISDWAQVSVLDLAGIKVIINAAAYTNVDDSETDAGKIKAWQVNAIGSANFVSLVRDKDLVLLHISTDYVFDGSNSPHSESESFSPLGVYGQSKAAADIAVSTLKRHYILRTSWVIGDGKNFVRTMLNLASQEVNPQVVDDQFGRPSFTDEIANGIAHLLMNESQYGTYNLSNSGEVISWAKFAEEIYIQSSIKSRVVGISSSEYFSGKPTAAPRPLNSTFDLGKIQASGFTPKDWRENLAEYLSKEGV